MRGLHMLRTALHSRAHTVWRLSPASVSAIAERVFLQETIKKVEIFDHLSEDQIADLVACMELGFVIITQSGEGGGGGRG